MLGQAGQIFIGHLNEFLNLETELYNKRKPICNSCKLKIKIDILGKQVELCNPNIYLNPITNETSSTLKEGFYKGCGCRLEASTRVKDKVCPTGKW